MHDKSVIFLGTKPAASLALKMLIDRGWIIKAVVTPADDPHPWISGPKVGDVAEENGIPVFHDKISLNLRPFEADLVVSYMYRSLVALDTNSSAKVAALNFHPAPHPYFGGWAFYNVAIIEGVSSYGPTCHHMDEGFDTGDLVKVDSFEIDARKETAVSLERKTQTRMLKLFEETINAVENDIQLPRIKQKKSEMRYFNKKQFESLKRLSLSSSAEEIERFARAFWYPPYQGAYFEIGSKQVEIIPELVKEDLAERYHLDDFETLRDAIYVA